MTQRQLPTELLPAAREWVADCEWADLDPEEVGQLTAENLSAGVAKHYDGGIEAFVRDGTVAAEEPERWDGM